MEPTGFTPILPLLRSGDLLPVGSDGFYKAGFAKVLLGCARGNPHLCFEPDAICG